MEKFTNSTQLIKEEPMGVTIKHVYLQRLIQRCELNEIGLSLLKHLLCQGCHYKADNLSLLVFPDGTHLGVTYIKL